MPPAIELTNVRFAWNRDTPDVVDIGSLRVERGERVLLRGPSGSGKSSLLSLLAGIVVPRGGSLRVLDRDLHRMAGADRDRFRADHVGFIFQLFNLIPYLSVLENVCLPCGFSPTRRARAAAGGMDVEGEAMRLLEQLDMGQPALMQRPVTELSVGQQQRVAAARALIGAPEIVVADEPTSSLDEDRRASFLDLLFRECERQHTTLVFVSHDASIGSRFDRQLAFNELNRPGMAAMPGAAP